jgi:RHS repeat-associated protein
VLVRKSLLKYSYGVLTGFAFDYFLKDHLGNVRAVVTDEVQQDIYPAATLEPGLVGTERGFYNIDTTKIVPNVMANELRDAYGNIQTYPNNNTFIANNNSGCGTGALCTTTNSGYVYQLNSNSNKTGLGIVLKVMAGDKLSIAGKSYYNQNTTGTGGNSPLPFVDILAGFLGSASGTGGLHSGITLAQINPGTSNATVNGFLSDQSTQSNSNQTRPKAFVNVLFFDEQFKLAGYKLSMVGNNKELKSHLAELQNIAVPKNGYMYIYCSNESPVPVYFDNIQVVHDRGALLEESHYYPFGLVQQGISSKAAGSLKNKENTFQGQRFDDDLALNWVQFKWRNHDVQTGRFIEIDPLAEKYEYNSTYAFSENKVTGHVELEGLEAVVSPEIYKGDGLTAMKEAAQTTFNVLNGVWKAFRSMWKKDVVGAHSSDDFGDATITDKIDHVIEVFKNGSAEEREEMVGQLGFGLLLGKLISSGSVAKGAVAEDAAVTNGVTTAGSFFAEKGLDVKLFDGIDFNKPVSVTTLAEGTKLVQWRPAGSTSPTGNWYTTPGADPSKLGIPSSYTQAFDVVLKQPVKVLQSTAADIKDWTGGPNVFKGGAIQFISNEIKIVSKFTKR